jgi:hypothetical protein
MGSDQLWPRVAILQISIKHAAKFCSNLSTIYNKFYDKAFKLAFTISFSESWNFCAATPCKELMKTEDPEDSCEFDIQESMSASLLSVSNFF